MKLTQRVNNIQPSATMAAAAVARTRKERGQPVFDLTAGEPDFDTPDHVKEAGIAAINSGFTNYTAADGTNDLKQAIVDKFSRDNNLSYDVNQVMASVGAKHCIFNVLQVLVEEGDEVLIPQPVWVSYPDMVILNGGTPVPITAGINQHFKITPEQLERAITDRTRLLMLNSPCNPTGAVYSRAELEAIGEVLKKHPQIVVVTDDIYEHIIWTEEPFCNIVNACPELEDRTIVVNGVSKAYAMTGWRIGYAAGPKTIIDAMRKVQTQSTSNPTSIAQVAATAALTGQQECVTAMVRDFKQRHQYVVGRLNELNGVRCVDSDGTFYAFPDFSQFIASHPEIDDDLALADHVVNEFHVALVPGSPFGGNGHLRLSFASSQTELEGALDQLQKLTGK